MASDVPVATAFVAGVASFLSPCVLPLVPVYLAHLAGVAVEDVRTRVQARVASNALAFVAGFSAVFVVLGIALGATGALVSSASLVASNRFWLVRLGGALLVVLGLHHLGLISLPFLSRERRLHLGTARPGHLTSSFLVGVTFGAGWTPCVGPILGAILTMAAGQGNTTRAALLLAAYAAGMGLTFLLAGLAFSVAPGSFRWVNGRLGALTSVSGAVMVAVGAIMLLGIYQQVFAELASWGEWTPWEPRL